MNDWREKLRELVRKQVRDNEDLERRFNELGIGWTWFPMDYDPLACGHFVKDRYEA